MFPIDHGIVHSIAESDNKMSGALFDSNPVVFIWGEHSWGGVANVWDHLCATSQTLLSLPNGFRMTPMCKFSRRNVDRKRAHARKEHSWFKALVKTEENTEQHQLSKSSVKRLQKQNSIKWKQNLGGKYHRSLSIAVFNSETHKSKTLQPVHSVIPRRHRILELCWSGSIYRQPSLRGIRILRVGAQCLCPTPSMLTLTPARSFRPETPSWWTRTEWRHGTSTPPPAQWCWPGPARGRRRTAESHRYRSCSHPGDLRRGEMKL